MKTGPGSPARWLAYAIDSLIIARITHIHSTPATEDEKKMMVDRAVDNLETAIGENL